jgi:MFS family permease
MQFRETQPILWRQVWGLAAILAAVTFSWMIYSLYQPKILQELGFIQLAAWLGIIQGLIGAMVEPILGGFSDQIQRRYGSRLPMITVGVTLAGLIFVGSALFLQWQIPSGLRWIVPVLMTLWVISMISFRGPVIALLRQTAPLKALPQANVVLTMVFGFVGAMEPVIGKVSQQVGASIAFVLGAIALTTGATILYRSAPKSHLIQSPSTRSDVSLRQRVLIFTTGLGVGIGINLLIRLFPQGFYADSSLIHPDWIPSAILLISAFMAIPLSILTAQRGLNLAMLSGLFGILLCLGLVQLHPGGIGGLGLVAIAGIAFGLVFESQIPLALGLVPPDRAGFGTGLYFGGIGAATAFISILLRQLNPISGFTGLLVGAISFGMVVFCLFAIHQVKNYSTPYP